MADSHTGESRKHQALLPSGSLVDHYRIVRPVGRGGMGEVYLARDIKLGRKVALKVIRPEALGSDQARERFLFEARITAKFSHPHIVTIHAVGEHKGTPYLALEYLEGETLKERMQVDHPGPREAMRIGLAIAEALKEAHQHQVLHRDLKPGNVFIPRDGRLRVLDFGVAKVVHAPAVISFKATLVDGWARQVTTTEDLITTDHEHVIGTPAFLAPERWRGEDSTEAADIWAFGVMLHELAYGCRPYPNAPADGLRELVSSPKPVPKAKAPVDMPPGLSGLIAECLEKKPASRPSAMAIVEALEDMLSQGRVRRTRAESPFRGLLPFGERHADFFFGRDAEVAALLERLREQPVLPVVGPSGAGKSSFVQAGLVPRLKDQGTWTILRLRPGHDPFGTLASRLVSGESSIGSQTGPLETGSPTVKRRKRPTIPGHARGDPPADPSGDGPTPKSRIRNARGADFTPTVRLSNRPRNERSSGPLPAQPSSHGGVEKALAAQLRESPSLLNLMLQEIAEKQDSLVLLFVDQAEELYTLVDDEEVGRRFMQAICMAADDPQGDVRVIFTLRDDYLGRAAEGIEVREALSQVTVMRSPGEAILEEVLRKPLEAVQYHYDDPGLVHEMVSTVRGEPDCLPLLQFTARMLWDRRDRSERLLRRSVYDAMGGVAGALAEHADGVLKGLSPDQMHLAREVLLRLVTPEGTRSAVSTRTVLDGLDAGAQAVIDLLIAARLVSVRRSLGDKQRGDAELELVHESLIHTWTRLARWIEESHEDLAFMSEVTQAAELWKKRGCRNEEVWNGEALREARRSLGRCTTRMPDLAKSFLVAGVRVEQRLRRRRRVLLSSGVATLAVVAMVSIVVALAFAEKEREANLEKERTEVQRKQAEAQRAEARRSWAEAQREGARAAFERGDLIEARAKVRGALETRDSQQSRAVWWRLERTSLLWKKRFPVAVYAVDFSPDSKTVAVACHDRVVRQIDVQTRATRTLRGHASTTHCVAMSPDGQRLASGGAKGEVLIWDRRTGRSRVVRGHSARVLGVHFSPDGEVLASCGADRTVRMWSTRTGKALKTLSGHTESVNGVTFDPSGKLLASASNDRTVRLWRVGTGELLKTLRGHTGSVRSLAFSPDGRLLASASRDKTIRIWKPRAGETLKVLRGHDEALTSVSFSPDGLRVASASLDKTIRIWGLDTGATRRILRGHNLVVYGVKFSPNGRLIASVSYDRTLRLWDLAARPAPKADGHQAEVGHLSFSPDGRLIATASADGTARIWSARTGATRMVLHGHVGPVYTAIISPNGRILATAGGDKTVRLWHVPSGRPRLELRGHKATVTSARFSVDGRLLASSSFDDTARIWSAGTGALRQVLRGHRAGIWTAKFGPKGRLLATGSQDHTVRLWTVKTGRPLGIATRSNAPVIALAFSPNGKILAIGDNRGNVRLWNPTTKKGRLLGRHPAGITQLDFHHQGGLLAVAVEDGTARLWDLSTGKHRTLRGHRAVTNDARFSPDGRLIGTTSDDGSLRLWETRSGNPVWRAPLLRRTLPELYTHLGWVRLDKASKPRARARTARWRAAVETRARLASESPDGRLVCLRTHDDVLEMWDIPRDKRIGRLSLPGLTRTIALRDGCLTLAAGGVRRHPRRGATQKLCSDANAIATVNDEILVASGRLVTVYAPSTLTPRTYATGEGVTALTRVGDWIAVGYGDGGIELVPTRPGQVRPGLSFESLPASPVVKLIAGPRGTLVSGYANGVVGLWSMRSGARLEHSRLHGPVIHVLFKGNRLYAASELGQHLVWDLSVFFQDYCQLLKQVWNQVKVVWKAGYPVARPPPERHRCAVR